MGFRSFSSVDRISELPDFILHGIVALLPRKNAARTCVLSKRWQHIWETFPVIDCNETFFGVNLWYRYPGDTVSEDELHKIYNKRMKLMSYVDYRLRRFGKENLSVKKFRLRVALVNMNLTPRIDAWLELVTGLGIQELDLDIAAPGLELYNFPLQVFLAANSLTILNLKDCVTIQSLPSNSFKLQSLVELNIASVFVEEETVRNLLCCSPLLEIFSLDCCWGFKQLDLLGHEKLKKLKFRSCGDLGVEKLRIEILSMEELDFCIQHAEDLVCEVIAGFCKNLNRLSLEGIPISGEWLQNMVSCFGLLEYLSLSFCSLQDTTLKLSSSMLKEVHLKFCKEFVEAELHAPALRTFKFVGCDMPHLSLNNVTAYRTARLLESLTENIENSWFIRLSNFLKFGNFPDLELDLHATDEERSICFDVEDPMGQQLPLPVGLENLKLALHSHLTINCSALLDGLLCISHPKILSLELDFISVEYVQKCFKRLLLKKSDENPKNLRCWRDSLKDITSIGVKGRNLDVQFDPTCLKLLNSLRLEDYELIDSSLWQKFTSSLDSWVNIYSNRFVAWLYLNLSW